MTLSFLLVKKFFPAFNAFLILIFSLLALFLVQYSLVFYLVFVSLAIASSFLFLLFLLGKEVRLFWPLLIFFPLVIASINFFLIFTKSQSVKIIFIFVASLFAYLFLTTVFRFLYEPRKYPPYSLENFSFSLSFIDGFLFFSIIFALITFFNLSLTKSLFFVFCLGLGLTIFVLWTIKLSVSKTHIFIVSLILLELFYALTFLPTSFYINSLVLTTLFFLMINLVIKKSKEGILASGVVGKHIFFASLALILIMLVAQWRWSQVVEIW